MFFGYSYGTGQTDAIFQGDYESDNMLKGPAGNENKWAYGKVKAESNRLTGTTATSVLSI